MKKIIHLSDLHIGYKDMSSRFQCVTDNLIFATQPAQDFVVLMTGDLVDNATQPSSYDEAGTHIKRLEDEGYTVLVVPGNHDYGTGILSSKKYVESFKQAFFGTTDIQYPKLDIVDGIAFIGLDSMAEELHWYDRMWANGELGKEQLGRLESILNEESVKTHCTHRVVYLHHHPFDPLLFHELKDSELLGDVLRKNHAACVVDALLYGHNHRARKSNDTWGIRRCYDAGSATMKYGTGRHRIIDLAADPKLDYDGDFHGNY